MIDVDLRSMCEVEASISVDFEAKKYERAPKTHHLRNGNPTLGQVFFCVHSRF